jgi:GT2 family glycosyltransferase
MSQPCSVIIPNYNGARFLRRCIPSLFDAIACDGEAHEVIVVDNGSTDDSLAYLERAGEPVRVIDLPNNIGFAAACNRGAEEARHDVLLFLNNDMYFEQGFLGPLLSHFDGRDDVFAISGQIWDWDGHFRIGRVYGRFLLGSFQVGHDPRMYRQPCYTLYTSGAASAMDRRKFQQLGGFDEMLYIYEDVDIGYRAWKRGWLVLHEPRSIVYHKERATSRQIFSNQRYLTINLKNRYWFMWKNFTDGRVLRRYIALLPISLLFLTLRMHSPAPLLAFLSALWGLGPIHEQRRQEAQMVVRSDTEVLRFVREHVYAE